MRALESKRPQHRRRLYDPFAHHLLEPSLRAAVEAFPPTLTPAMAHASRGLLDDVVLRHARIDDRLRAEAHAVERILILGAGLDTRSYRLRDLGVPVVELDLPATQAEKQKRLKRVAGFFPRAQVEFQAVDFRNPSWPDRVASLSGRCAVVWEGVSMYLRAEEVRATARALSGQLEPGSVVMLDTWCRPRWQPATQLAAWGLASLGEPLRFALRPADTAGFFAPLGFSVESVEVLAENQNRCARGTPAHLALVTLRVQSADGPDPA